jgi:hypothetical protein
MIDPSAVGSHSTVFYADTPPTQPRVEPFSTNLSIINDIADAMHVPPITYTSEYYYRCQRAAAYLGKPVILSTGLAGASPLPVPPNFQNPFGAILLPWFSPVLGVANANPNLRNAVMAARNNVFEIINKVNAFVARAKNGGFAPPDNPFVVIAEFNEQRTGWTAPDISPTLADDLVFNIGAYLDLLKADSEGKIDLTKSAYVTAQLSSVTLSLAGFGGSGDAASDLLRFIPDMDAVKVERAREALSVLDFKKRIPKSLFTAEYAPDGEVKGVIVGWKRIADASGYVITRRNIFDGKTASYQVSNSQLVAIQTSLEQYLKTWVMSFYDNVPTNTIYSYLDSVVPGDGYFIYKIQAYQVQNQTNNTLFTVPTKPAPLLSQTRDQVRKLMQSLEGADVTTGDTISPYPVLAHLFLGDQKHDWILAGLNIRTSITRGDDRAATRKFSYLAAQLEFLLDQIQAGKFVVPTDITQVAQRVNDGIVKFGVTQVLQEILQETGILYYFEGKDPKQDTHFDKVGTSLPQTSNLLSLVMAATDPETATLDLKALATNLPQLLAGDYVGVSDVLGGSTPLPSQPKEVPVPEIDNPTDAYSADEVQFLRRLGNLDENHVDLTTFDGISVFVRAIRIISDIGPSRGAPIDVPPKVVVPDPVPPAPPPPVVVPAPGSDPAPKVVEEHTGRDRASGLKTYIK